MTSPKQKLLRDIWTIDANGYLLSPAGTKVARFTDGVLYLYDKRTRSSLPLTLDHYVRLASEPDTQPPQ
jgi:hypothetical protein